MENLKSRDIPINDLFYNLQLEWISYYVRLKTYERDIELNIFKDICKMKKDKIETFSLKNSISSIFNNEKKLDKFLNEFNTKGQVPKFQYTPKNIKSYQHWDKFYFFKFGVEVYHEGELVKILKNDTFNDKVEFLNNKREYKIVPYNEVWRDILILF